MATGENKTLIRAKVGLILKQPFFATLMMKRKFIETREIKTMCTNGDWIKYNPDFIESITLDELKGVICHELLHIANMHHLRRQGREPKRWNIACDHPINEIILKSDNMSLPDGRLYDPEYSNMSAEQIYKLLPEGDDGNGEGDGTGGEMGEVEDAPIQSEAEMEQAVAQVQQEVAQAAQIARQQGKLPGALERLVEEVIQPKINWKEVLARFLSEIAKNDYSFSRPNPRYIGSGFILPSLHSIEMGKVVLIVDTSMSIDRPTLDRFAGEMQDICSMYDTHIKVLYVDEEVCGEQDIDPDEPIAKQLKPKGGGGTDFVPGFKWLEENGIEPKAVVYFTDLECNSYPEEPEFPVLWAFTGSNSYYRDKVPFGEVVDID